MINEPWYGKTKETYGIHEQKTFESSGQRPDEATTKTQYFCIDVRIFALHKILKSLKCQLIYIISVGIRHLTLMLFIGVTSST